MYTTKNINVITTIITIYYFRENQDMGGGQTVMFTSDPKIIRNEKEKVRSKF